MMKRFFVLASVLVSAGLSAMAAGEEQQFIAVLQSDHSLQEKDAACAQLKWIGADAAIPALAALLTDEQLSHSARYALESMASPKAEEALLDALAKTGGLTRVGIINSLGFRAEEKATAPLVPLLGEADAVTAAAAAEALGHIGGAEALKALEASRPTASASSLRAIDDGLLRCANSLWASGNRAEAQKVFRELYDNDQAEAVRVASFRGLIETSGNPLPLMIAAIKGSDGPSQMTALQWVREVKAPGATEAFANLLPDLSSPVQVSIIDGLGQRGDPAALAGLSRMTDSETEDVRLAAIAALGEIGDESVIPALSRFVISSTAAEKKAARAALLKIRRGNVTDALLKELANTPAPAQLELGRLLGERADRAAVPRLLQMAGGSAPARAGSLQALAMLADGSSIPPLVELATASTTDDDRAQAAETVDAICQRMQAKGAPINGEALFKALKGDSVAVRVVLLPVCGGLTDPSARQILRDALRDNDARVRAAALGALCATRDAELLPDLVRLASASQEDRSRLLAIRGCVRLLTQEEGVKFDHGARLEAFKTILSAGLGPEEKRAVLAGLAAVPDARALELIVPLTDDPAVRKEAIQALIQLAPALPDAPAAAAALRQALNKTDDPETHKAGERALKDLAAKTPAGK
jgi:HEAT repeat protein